MQLATVLTFFGMLGVVLVVLWIRGETKGRW
jgi:hypothetical protein